MNQIWLVDFIIKGFNKVIKELIYKLFGLEDFPCDSCETLRHQLEVVNYEKEKLLDKLLDKEFPIEKIRDKVEYEQPKLVPWAIRKELLEQEDRIKAKLMRESTEKLEKELEIS